MVQPTSSTGSFLRCLTVAALLAICNWSLSNSVYPTFSAIAPITRYAATAVGGIGLLVLITAASRAPRLLDFRVLRSIVVIGFVFGVIFAVFGVRSAEPVMVVVGACAISLTRTIIELFAILAISCLKQERIIPCVCLSFLAAAIVQFLLSFFPVEVGQILNYTLPLIALLLISKIVAPVFLKLQKTVAPEVISVTRPDAFLPFYHQLFIFILLSRFAHGYTLGLGELEGGIPQIVNFVSLIPPFALLAMYSIVLPKRFNMDLVYLASMFLMVAGFMFIPFDDALIKGIPNTLLSTGSNCFLALLWCAFALIANKNKQEGLLTFSWGRALYALAVTLGAFLGRSYNDMVSANEQLAAFSSMLIALIFIGVFLFVLKDFSVVKTVQDIRTMDSFDENPKIRKPIEGSCERLGSEYGLTPREIEILILVAKGRNAPYIEEKLFISRNTVKSHVKHIYRKLGVHTNQELINMVEKTSEA